MKCKLATLFLKHANCWVERLEDSIILDKLDRIEKKYPCLRYKLVRVQEPNDDVMQYFVAYYRLTDEEFDCIDEDLDEFDIFTVLCQDGKTPYDPKYVIKTFRDKY